MNLERLLERGLFPPSCYQHSISTTDCYDSISCSQWTLYPPGSTSEITVVNFVRNPKRTVREMGDGVGGVVGGLQTRATSPFRKWWIITICTAVVVECTPRLSVARGDPHSLLAKTGKMATSL
jgi:hypothetical protein